MVGQEQSDFDPIFEVDVRLQDSVFPVRLENRRVRELETIQGADDRFPIAFVRNIVRDAYELNIGGNADRQFPPRLDRDDAYVVIIPSHDFFRPNLEVARSIELIPEPPTPVNDQEDEPPVAASVVDNAVQR